MKRCKILSSLKIQTCWRSKVYFGCIMCYSERIRVFSILHLSTLAGKLKPRRDSTLCRYNRKEGTAPSKVCRESALNQSKVYRATLTHRGVCEQLENSQKEDGAGVWVLPECRPSSSGCPSGSRFVSAAWRSSRSEGDNRRSSAEHRRRQPAQ